MNFSLIRHFFARFSFPAILAFAACFATQVYAQSAVQADTMAKRMQACTTCHGAQGVTSNQAYFPRIAGKPAGYLFNQLQNFKEGRRHYGLMVGMVEHLSAPYLLEMAQYFAALDVPYAQPAPLKTPTSAAVLQLGKTLALQGDTARNLAACTSCHGTALMGVLPSTPALLGLPRDYLAAQLGAWQTGLRKAHAPDCMGRIAKVLTPSDIDAVSNWLASQPVPTYAKAAASLPQPQTEQCGGAK
ncbi:MAG: c-type cytochrome [Burkholderiaceae bacterium]